MVSELKKLAAAADTVWLATDEDREGEAISWHLFEALNLEKKDTKRITFNEITKAAILKAIENPRKINKELVDAQQARRVLDRIVGFELSPVLWKKVRPSLSAGRVQSVAVRLIVEREKEIDQHNSKNFFKVIGNFRSENGLIKAELDEQLKAQTEAQTLLENLRTASFSISDIQQKPATKRSVTLSHPPPLLPAVSSNTRRRDSAPGVEALTATTDSNFLARSVVIFDLSR